MIYKHFKKSEISIRHYFSTFLIFFLLLLVTCIAHDKGQDKIEKEKAKNLEMEPGLIPVLFQ